MHNVLREGCGRGAHERFQRSTVLGIDNFLNQIDVDSVGGCRRADLDDAGVHSRGGGSGTGEQASQDAGNGVERQLGQFQHHVQGRPLRFGVRRREEVVLSEHLDKQLDAATNNNATHQSDRLFDVGVAGSDQQCIQHLKEIKIYTLKLSFCLYIDRIP